MWLGGWVLAGDPKIANRAKSMFFSKNNGFYMRIVCFGVFLIAPEHQKIHKSYVSPYFSQ